MHILYLRIFIASTSALFLVSLYSLTPVSFVLLPSLLSLNFLSFYYYFSPFPYASIFNSITKSACKSFLSLFFPCHLSPSLSPLCSNFDSLTAYFFILRVYVLCQDFGSRDDNTRVFGIGISLDRSCLCVGHVYFSVSSSVSGVSPFLEYFYPSPFFLTLLVSVSFYIYGKSKSVSIYIFEYSMPSISVLSLCSVSISCVFLSLKNRFLWKIFVSGVYISLKYICF